MPESKYKHMSREKLIREVESRDTMIELMHDDFADLLEKIKYQAGLISLYKSTMDIVLQQQIMVQQFIDRMKSE